MADQDRRENVENPEEQESPQGEEQVARRGTINEDPQGQDDGDAERFDAG